jgi:ribose 5-phosphate isomerase B
MKILIASDHGGYYLKQELKSYLEKKGHQIKDFGNLKYDPSDDYTDFVIPLARRLAKDGRSLAIILGRSGNGEAIAANKTKGVYAALCLTEKMATRARQHNNANVISLGAEYISPTSAKRVVDAFLKTPFSQASRHQRRVKAIKSYESAHYK